MWTRRMAEPRRRLDSGTAPSRGSFKPGTRAYAVQAQPECNDAPSWERHSSPPCLGLSLWLWSGLTLEQLLCRTESVSYTHLTLPTIE